MKKYFFLSSILSFFLLSNPGHSSAACPSLFNGNDVSINNSENCSLTAGNTYIDKATTEASTTNAGTLTINSGGSLTIINGATLHAPTFTINNGGILYVQDGGTLSIKGNNSSGIWIADSDADGWAGNLSTTYNATAAGRRRLGLMRSGSSADCNDNNYSINNIACISATGGTITTISGYKIHTFNSSGTFTISSGSGTVEYLIAAGGGKGGNGSGVEGDGLWGGGGGGAGGMTTGSTSMSAGAYSVTVGAGGTTSARNGTNSVFNGITMSGGGAGGTGTTSSGAGVGGGSGGGGTRCSSGGSGTTNQGSSGGTSIGCNGAGGGGKTGVGGASGGTGSASSITGTSITYSIGGNPGGNFSNYGPDTPGTPTANRGYGGGGGNCRESNGVCSNGADGGSGVVIVRYPWE